MKNVCVVIKNERKTLSESDYIAVLDGFASFGYAFDELRVLLKADETKIRAVLTEVKKEYDNVLVLTEKTSFSPLQTLLSTVCKEETFGGTNGASIFSDKERSVFLLSFGGVDYIASVCVPYLQKKCGVKQDKIVIRAIGANEARVEALLAQAKSMDRGVMTYLHTRKNDEDVIRIIYDGTVSRMLTDDVLRLFVEGLGDTVYAIDDTPLEKQLVQLLKLRGRKISVAESFTGGGIARRIVSVSGASEVYFEGINTYNERSKIKRLGVSEYTLGTMGAVSDQTAYEMAAGLIATGDCDISIATTGLAGPNTDKSMLPVGLCYIAVGTKERVYVYRYKFGDTREEITEKAINYALYLAYKQLKNI